MHIAILLEQHFHTCSQEKLQQSNRPCQRIVSAPDAFVEVTVETQQVCVGRGGGSKHLSVWEGGGGPSISWIISLTTPTDSHLLLSPQNICTIRYTTPDALDTITRARKSLSFAMMGDNYRLFVEYHTIRCVSEGRLAMVGKYASIRVTLRLF
jgi:hypothetical protein